MSRYKEKMAMVFAEMIASMFLVVAAFADILRRAWHHAKITDAHRQHRLVRHKQIPILTMCSAIRG